MAPLQTTSSSWAGPEVTVVVRFWIVALSVAAGLGIFYAESVVLL